VDPRVSGWARRCFRYIEQAKRSVLESNKTIRLQSDACSMKMNQVRTKILRLIDKGKAFNERPSHSSFSGEEVGFAEAAAHATYSWHGALSLPKLRGSYELVYKLNVSVHLFRTLRVCLQQRGIRTLQRSIDS
jgi:hypothetical protein